VRNQIDENLLHLVDSYYSVALIYGAVAVSFLGMGPGMATK
jgi:hypothetical protein